MAIFKPVWLWICELFETRLIVNTHPKFGYLGVLKQQQQQFFIWPYYEKYNKKYNFRK